MAMDFTIIYEFPASDLERAWRDCLSRVQYPAHYDAPEFFAEPYWKGKRPFAVLALEADRVAGVLTGLHGRHEVMSGLPSRPQICVDTTMDVHAALDALARGLQAEQGSAELMTVYSWPSLDLSSFSAHGFRCRKLRGTVVLDLTQGPEALFKQFSKDRRRNIRFAEKNGVEISQASSAEDIVEAYEVYRAWRKTDRKEVVGETRTFEVFKEAALLTGNRRIFLARASGKVIAINIFRFFPGGLFESAANHSLEQFLHLKPNELLQWRGIEWACSQGLLRHSLGGSHEFLLRFGGTVVPILRYRLDRTWLRKHDLREAVLDIGRNTLRRLPPSVEKKVRRVSGK
jgi:hypothetical protein